jgi:predicted small secreted protein
MITQSRNTLAFLLVTLLLALSSIGCNTWRGLGKDVSKTGDSMQGDR